MTVSHNSHFFLRFARCKPVIVSYKDKSTSYKLATYSYKVRVARNSLNS